MTIKDRTALATLLRHYNQGFIDSAELYHLVCNLFSGEMKGEMK